MTTKQLIPVTESAILKRINRKLNPELEGVQKLRGWNPPARYFHVNLNYSSVIAQFDDLEDYARELECLRPNETLAD